MPLRTSGFGRGLATVVLASLLLAACTGIPVQPADEQVATTAAGYGRAFGRVVFVEDGTQKTWSTGALAMDVLALFVRSVETGEMQRMEIKGDGSFFWPLKAGSYVVVAFSTIGPNRTGRIWTTFSVPRAGDAAYIGTLRIEMERGHFAVGVEDQYAEALPKVQAQLDEKKLTPVKALMRTEGRLGTYTSVQGVCAERWGGVCDRTHQGVVPVQPVDANQSLYPPATSLEPLLEWKPSSKPGLTYDVAVYESLTLTLDVQSAPRARGNLMAYAQNLAVPMYRLTTPLLPGKKYDWSVRLRDGDAVSSWSTQGYFTFFGLGWASGSGKWFGFSTPEK